MSFNRIGGFTAGLAVISSIVLTPLSVGAAPLNEDTPITVKLLQDLKSGHERKGDRIQLAVVEDVTVDRQVVLPKGTPVVGTVTRSNGRGMFGKPGKLEFSIDYIKVSDQVRVPLRNNPTSVRGRNNSAAAITTAVILAPIAIFVKGREVKVEQGHQYTVYVDKTTEVAAIGSTASPAKTDPTPIIQLASFAPPPAPAPVAAPTPAPQPAAQPQSQKPGTGLMVFKLTNGDSITGTLIAYNDGVRRSIGRLIPGSTRKGSEGIPLGQPTTWRRKPKGTIACR